MLESNLCMVEFTFIESISKKSRLNMNALIENHRGGICHPPGNRSMSVDWVGCRPRLVPMPICGANRMTGGCRQPCRNIAIA